MIFFSIFCKSIALRKFCPLLLLHCSPSLWDNQLQMVPVPDILCLTYVRSHSGKSTAVAIVPEKLVNASKRKTFSAASIKWSKRAWHLLTFLDSSANQNKFNVEASFNLQNKTHNWGLCTLIIFLGPYPAWIDIEFLNGGSYGNYKRVPGRQIQCWKLFL